MNAAEDVEPMAPQSAASEGVRRGRRRYSRVDRAKMVVVTIALGGDVSKAARKLKIPRRTVGDAYRAACRRMIQGHDELLTNMLTHWRRELEVSLEAVAKAMLEGVPTHRVLKVVEQHKRRLANPAMPVPSKPPVEDPVPVPPPAPEPAPVAVVPPKPAPAAKPVAKVKPKVWFSLPG